MLDRMLTPEELTELDKRIAANADEIITKGFNKPQRISAKILYNDLQEDISIIHNHCCANDLIYPNWLDDLVTAATRMNHGDKPLKRTNVLKVLGSVKEITTSSIMHRLNIKESSAKEYFAAIRVIYPKLLIHVKEELSNIESDLGAFFED